MATPAGLEPTLIGSDTDLVAVLITETVPLRSLATYTNVPFGLMATPLGLLPTVMVSVTVLVSVAITETVLKP